MTARTGSPRLTLCGEIIFRALIYREGRMKRFPILIIIFLLAGFNFGCKDKAPETSCLYGGDIPKEDLDPILETGKGMVSLVEAGEFKKLYQTSSSVLKKTQNQDQFTYGLKLFTDAFGPIEYSRPEEVYLMEANAKEERVWIPCNLGKEGVSDLWGMPSNEELAVVIFKSRTDLELVRLVFQLQKEAGEWRLRSLSLHPITIDHKLYGYYAKKAREFREQNLLHLSVLYYKTAMLLSDIGLNVNEFTVRTLGEQMGQIKVDYMPENQVQLWSMPSGKSYKVYNMDAAYDEGKLLVHVNYVTDSLDDKEKLRDEARELASFLDNKFPEYRQGFEGFRVTAASEKPRESMMAYHTTVTFEELGEREGAEGSGEDSEKKPG